MKFYMLRPEYAGRAVRLTRYIKKGGGALMESVSAEAGVRYDESYNTEENRAFLREVSPPALKKPVRQDPAKPDPAKPAPAPKRGMPSLRIRPPAQPVAATPVKPEPPPDPPAAPDPVAEVEPETDDAPAPETPPAVPESDEETGDAVAGEAPNEPSSEEPQSATRRRRKPTQADAE